MTDAVLGGQAVATVLCLRRRWAEALADGDDVFARRFGHRVEPGWAGFPDALADSLAAVIAGGSDPWGPHLIFDAADLALVGFGGFKGPPRRGVVEIGYAIAPSRRGRGLATSAAAQLVDQAERAGALRVRAHTLAVDGPSPMVLRRCGFRRTGSAWDDGLAAEVWRWELSLRRR